MTTQRFKVGQPVMTPQGRATVQEVGPNSLYYLYRVSMADTLARAYAHTDDLTAIFAVGDRVSFSDESEGVVVTCDSARHGVGLVAVQIDRPSLEDVAGYSPSVLTWLSSATQVMQQPVPFDDGYEFSVGDDVRITHETFTITERERSMGGRASYRVNGEWLYADVLILVMPVGEASAARHQAAGRTWQGMQHGGPDIFTVADIKTSLINAVFFEPVKCAHVLCAITTVDVTGFCSDRCLDFQGARDVALAQLASFKSKLTNDPKNDVEEAWADKKTDDALKVLETRFTQGFNKTVDK